MPQFAAWLDEAVDGDEGSDHGHGHARADAPDEALQQAIQAEVLPGAQGDVDIAETAWLAPGDGLGDRPSTLATGPLGGGGGV